MSASFSSFASLMKMAKEIPQDSFRIIKTNPHSSSNSTNAKSLSSSTSARHSPSPSTHSRPDSRSSSVTRKQTVSTRSLSPSFVQSIADRSSMSSSALPKAAPSQSRLSASQKRILSSSGLKKKPVSSSVSSLAGRSSMGGSKVTSLSTRRTGGSRSKNSVPSDLIQVNTVKKDRASVEEVMEQMRARKDKESKPIRPSLSARSRIVSGSRTGPSGKEQPTETNMKKRTPPPALSVEEHLERIRKINPKAGANVVIPPKPSSSKESAYIASLKIKNESSTSKHKPSSSSSSVKRKSYSSESESDDSVEVIRNRRRSDSPSDDIIRKKSRNSSSGSLTKYGRDDRLQDEQYVKKNVSSIIGEMFRYDRRRYRDDEDDSDMEVGYSTVYSEERKSAKIAKREDEEEERKEAERLARIAKKKKKGL